VKRHSQDYRLLLVALAAFVITATAILTQHGGSFTGLFTAQEFSIAASISACGNLSAPGETFTLTASVSATSDCFTINESNIILDCAGFNIEYASGGTGHGVVALNVQNVTIRNCNITTNTDSSTFSHGINFTNVTNGLITRTNMSVLGGDSVGILLNGTMNVTINETVINTSGTGSNKVGIKILSWAFNDTIDNVTISTASTAGDNHGLHLNASSQGLRIARTTLTISASSGIGVYAPVAGVHNSTIENNRFNVNNNYGMYIEGSSLRNIIRNNFVNVTGAGGGLIGIRLIAGPYNTTLENNTVTVFAASGSNTGIYIDNNVYNSIVRDNNVTVGGGTDAALRLGSNNIRYTDVTNNILTTRSSSSSGIYMTSGAQFNILRNNTITSSASSSYGILLQAGSTSSNEFHQNRIAVTGSSSRGIRVNACTNNTFANNIINATGSGAYAILLDGSNDSVFVNTNLSRVANWISADSASNATFRNTTFESANAVIRLDGPVNVSNMDVSSQRVIVAHNTTFVDTLTYPALNSSALLTLYGISFASPEMLIDKEQDGTFDTCQDTVCSNGSYRNGELRMQVTHFSNYTLQSGASAQPYACGYVNENLTLTQDVNSSSDCFTINASNVVLDCAGYEVNYSQGAKGHGVVANATNNVTIRNCNIVNDLNNNDDLLNRSHGINFTDVNNSRILNNNFTVGRNASVGVYFVLSNNNTIVNNTINTTGVGFNKYGCILTNSSNNSILSNTILTQGTGDSNYGVYLLNASSWNVVSGNTVRTNGTSNNYGIALQTSANNNTVTNNTIRTGGSSDANYGIYLTSTSSGNLVSGNTVSTNGTSSNYGIRLISSASNNTVTNNTIQTEGSGGFNVGISFATTISGNVVSGNTIQTNGTNDNYGIRLETGTNNNSFANNNITTVGPGSYAIFIQTSNHSLFNNTLLTNPVQWLFTDVQTNNTFVNTSFIAANSSVRFYGAVNATNGTNVTRTALNLGFNTIFLNSTNLSSFNVSARLTFRNVAFANPDLFVDYDDDGTSVACGSDVCTDISFRNGVYDVNVTHFTNYTVQDGPSVCRDLNASFTLLGPANSSGTCFTTNASNIFLDCDGYVINYSQSQNGHGIAINNSNNVTVRNCVLSTGTNLVNFSHAINVTNSSNIFLENNSILARGNQSAGIWIQNSTNVTVNRSTIYTNGTGSNSYGVRIFGHNNNVVGNTINTKGLRNTNYGVQVWEFATGMLISSNVITTSGEAQNDGIVLAYANHGTIINANTITSGGNAAYSRGILVQQTTNATVTNNIILTNDTSGSGIATSEQVTNTTIRNNSVTANGNAVFLTNGADGTRVDDNRITINGPTGSSGGLTFQESGNASASGNVIRLNGTGGNNYGVLVYSTSDRINITDNVIYTNGTTTTVGIYVNNNIRNASIRNNTVATQGDGSDNYGIACQTTYGLTIANNTITTNGTNSSHGIYLLQNCYNSTISNNSITTAGRQGLNMGIRLGSSSAGNVLSHNRIVTSGTNDNHGISLNGPLETNTIIGTNVTTGGTGSYGIHVTNSYKTVLRDTLLHQSNNWVFVGATSNVTLTNTSLIGANSTIRYSQSLNLDGVLNVTGPLARLGNGSVALNGTNLTQLNTYAIVRILNTPYRNPEALVSFNDDGSFIICPSTICINQSVKDSNLTFVASGFSNYSVQLHHSEANITLNGDYNDISVVRDTAMTVVATLNVGEGVVDLYMNDTISNTEVLVGSGYNRVSVTFFANYAPQNYMFRAVYAGNENFTSSGDNATLIVYIPGSGGGIHHPATCIEVWSCRPWTECHNNQQQRICDEINSCITNIYQPPLNQSCNTTVVQLPSCGDGIQNQGESGIDCGSPCLACPLPPTCFDGMQDSGETGIDCGGACNACPVPVEEVPQPAPVPVAPVTPPAVTQPAPAPKKSVAGVVATVLGFIAVLGIVAGVVFKIMRRPPMGRGGAPKTKTAPAGDDSDLDIPDVEE